MIRLENLRDNYRIDKQRIININNNLTLPYSIPKITIDRTRNYITPDYEGRRVKDLDEIETMKTKQYGESLDVNLENIVNRMKKIMIKAPLFNESGDLVRYLGSSRIKSITIPLFNFIGGLTTLDPKNKIIALDQSINNLLDLSVNDNDGIDALRILNQNLLNEMNKQNNFDNDLINLVKESKKKIITSKKGTVLPIDLDFSSFFPSRELTPEPKIIRPVTGKQMAVKYKFGFVESELELLKEAKLIKDFESLKIKPTPEPKIIRPVTGKQMAVKYKFTEIEPESPPLTETKLIKEYFKASEIKPEIYYDIYNFDPLIDKLNNFKANNGIRIEKAGECPMGKFQNSFSGLYNDALKSYDIKDDDYKDKSNEIAGLSTAIRLNLQNNIQLIPDFNSIINNNAPFSFFPIHRKLVLGKTIYGLIQINVYDFFKNYYNNTIDDKVAVINHSIYNNFKNNAIQFRNLLKKYSIYLYDFNLSSFDQLFDDFLNNKNSFFLFMGNNIIFSKNIDSFEKEQGKKTVTSRLYTGFTKLGTTIMKVGQALNTGFLLEEENFDELYNEEFKIYYIDPKKQSTKEKTTIFTNFIRSIIDPITEADLFKIFQKPNFAYSCSFETRTVTIQQKDYILEFNNLLTLIYNNALYEPMDSNRRFRYLKDKHGLFWKTINKQAMDESYFGPKFLTKMLEKLKYFISHNGAYSIYSADEILFNIMEKKGKIKIQKNIIDFVMEEEIGDTPMGVTDFNDFKTWTGGSKYYSIKKSSYNNPLFRKFIDVINANSTNYQKDKTNKIVIIPKKEFTFDASKRILKAENYEIKLKPLDLKEVFGKILENKIIDKDIKIYHSTYTIGKENKYIHSLDKIKEALKKYYMYASFPGMIVTKTFNNGDELKNYFNKVSQSYLTIKKHEMLMATTAWPN
jgi:hypothetical protein